MRARVRARAARPRRRKASKGSSTTRRRWVGGIAKLRDQDDRGGTLLHGLIDEIVAVAMFALDGEEEIARREAARVDGTPLTGASIVPRSAAPIAAAASARLHKAGLTRRSP